MSCVQGAYARRNDKKAIEQTQFVLTIPSLQPCFVHTADRPKTIIHTRRYAHAQEVKVFRRNMAEQENDMLHTNGKKMSIVDSAEQEKFLTKADSHGYA